MKKFWVNTLFWVKKINEYPNGWSDELKMPKGAKIILITKGDARVLLHAIADDSVYEEKIHQFQIYVIHTTTCGNFTNGYSGVAVKHDEENFEHLGSFSLEDYGKEQTIHVFHKKM